jgi:MFS family permease
MLAQAAGPEWLGRVLGAIGVPAMLGVVLGPVVGGILITDLGWRWIFYVNLPIVAVALLIGGLVLLTAFVAHALTVRGEPLVDLRPMRSRSFAAASAVMFLFGGAMFGIALVVPLYFQLARGWSALHAGMLAGAGLGATMVAATAASYRDVPRPDIPAQPAPCGSSSSSAARPARPSWPSSCRASSPITFALPQPQVHPLRRRRPSGRPSSGQW